MKKKNLALIVLIALLFGCKSYVLTEKSSVNREVVKTESTNKVLTKIIEPYKTELGETMNTVIGVSEKEMTTGSPEGELGNFISDLCLRQGKEKYQALSNGDSADFVILNNGGFRTFLPKGNITRGKIFEIMPFENELVVVTLSIAKTVELFEYIAKKTVREGSRKQGVPVSGNVIVVVENYEPIEVLVDNIRLRGRPYKIITTDYLANGGDDMSFFLNPISYEKLGLKLRDAILNEVISLTKENKTISANLDKRIRYGK